jgi:hypothetical protein
MSSRGLSLHLPCPIAVGSPVQVESDELLLLGEVCNCSVDGKQYRVGLVLRHSLSVLPQLRAWNRWLKDEMGKTILADRR